MKKYLGKIIGGILGLLLTGGNPIGLLLGIWIGHWFDKSLNPIGTTNSTAQKAFFKATFLIMGHIAKADGRVSENEIQAARKTMSRFGLYGDRKKEAIAFFNQGKSSNFSLGKALKEFKENCPFDRGLMLSFIDIQIQSAYADGPIHPKSRQLLQHIAQSLGLGALNFLLYDMLFGFKNGDYHFHQYQQGQQRPHQKIFTSIDDAYTLLGISKKASDAEVKKAYRKMMSQNHPDKLIAKGLPEEMIKVATEKTQKIQKAYEEICKTRGM